MADMNDTAMPHGTLYDMRGLGFAAGDHVVVTGGGSGIGRAIALMAARSGLAVSVWDMHGETAEETAREAEALGARAQAIAADVADNSAVARAWEQTRGFGPCPFLVNNAGPPSGSTAPFMESLGIALGSMESVTSMWLERCADAAASVVNISSIAGNFHGYGKSTQPFYPTAKAGVAGFTRHLATRYDGKPRANAVAPGFTMTPRIRAGFDDEGLRAMTARVPLGRPGLPEEIAGAVLFLLSPAASFINGVLLPVDGGAAHS